MNKKLKLLLIKFLNNEITVLSWGITNTIISENSITFEVNGLKYAGGIKICIDNDKYKISLNDCIFYKNLDEVIDTIDKAVEYTDYYISDIEQIIIKNKK